MMVENKRAKGQGSVFQRTSDGRWIGVLSLPGPNGTRRRPSVSGATEEEATAKLDALIAQHTPHTIYLPKELGEKAIAKADENGETLTEVVQPAIEAYVQK